MNTLVRKEVESGRKDYQVHVWYAWKDVYPRLCLSIDLETGPKQL
jgi:hypothetical protein